MFGSALLAASVHNHMDMLTEVIKLELIQRAYRHTGAVAFLHTVIEQSAKQWVYPVSRFPREITQSGPKKDDRFRLKLELLNLRKHQDLICIVFDWSKNDKGLVDRCTDTPFFDHLSEPKFNPTDDTRNTRTIWGYMLFSACHCDNPAPALQYLKEKYYAQLTEGAQDRFSALFCTRVFAYASMAKNLEAVKFAIESLPGGKTAAQNLTEAWDRQSFQLIHSSLAPGEEDGTQYTASLIRCLGHSVKKGYYDLADYLSKQFATVYNGEKWQTNESEFCLRAKHLAILHQRSGDDDVDLLFQDPLRQRVKEAVSMKLCWGIYCKISPALPLLSKDEQPSAAYLALKQGDMLIAQCLLDNGAKIGPFGQEMMFMAAATGHCELASFLHFEQGISFTKANQWDISAYDVALRTRHYRLAALMARSITLANPNIGAVPSIAWPSCLEDLPSLKRSPILSYKEIYPNKIPSEAFGDCYCLGYATGELRHDDDSPEKGKALLVPYGIGADYWNTM